MPRECPAPQTWTNASGKLLEYQIWITECYLNIYLNVPLKCKSAHGQSPIITCYERSGHCKRFWATTNDDSVWVEWQPQTESTEARVAPEMPYITYHVKVKVPLFQLQLRPEVALFECYTGYTQIPFGRTLVAAMHTGQCKWNWGDWSSPLWPALAILTRSVSFIRPCLQLFVNLVKMHRDGQETHHL